MLDILRLIDRLHMPLRIAGCTNAEIAGCLDLCNEFRCIAIVVLNFSVLWNVTAQSQYILNPLCL